MTKGLGRRIAADKRDHDYLLAALPQDTITRRYRYWWGNGAWYDQGNTPSCVGHAFAHYLEDGPVTQPNLVADPFSIYHAAQQVDEWAGTDYDGTSVRAGAKVLASRGLISSYLWAWELETVITTVLEVGPVVMGTDWFEAMFATDANGYVHAEGDVAGGHAWVINGVNRNTRTFRGKNSWGRSFGIGGHFKISFDDVALLLARDGEACRAVEVQR